MQAKQWSVTLQIKCRERLTMHSDFALLNDGTVWPKPACAGSEGASANHLR